MWFQDGSNAYVYGRRRSLSQRLYPMPVEGEPVFAACGVAEHTRSEVATPQQTACLRRAVRGVLQWGGGSVFVNKRIANNLRVGLLASAFPAAKFVDITRDGRAVALSLSRVDWWEDSIVWWYGGTPAEWRASGRDPWELCARTWVEDVRLLDSSLERLPRERVLRLTYEEFTDAPHSTLQRVAEFCGLGEDAGWLAELQQLSFPNRNERWRADLPQDVAERITSMQAEELGRRGYR